MPDSVAQFLPALVDADQESSHKGKPVSRLKEQIPAAKDGQQRPKKGFAEGHEQMGQYGALLGKGILQIGLRLIHQFRQFLPNPGKITGILFSRILGQTLKRLGQPVSGKLLRMP